MTFRAWWADEFDQCKTDEERDELAWKIPDRRGLFNPEVITPCDDVDDAAEQYAEYFHNQRDGYENSWPIEFVVHDGTNYHRISVDRDYDPTFRSGKAEVFTP